MPKPKLYFALPKFWFFYLFISLPFGGIAQNMNRVQRVIDTLCSPSMHGRGYVAQGDKIAAAYLHEAFSKIGLQPFGEDYYQFFRLDINTFPAKINLKINQKKLTCGQDYIVNAISRSGKGKGKLLFLDSLLFSSPEKQAAFMKTKTHKQVIVFTSPDFSRMLDLPQPVLDKIYEAKALLELKQTKLIAALSTRQLSNPIFEVPEPLFDSLRRASSKKNKAKFRLDALLKRNYTSQNIIGYVRGSEQPDSFVVFSAHYDHLGHLGKDVYFPGANDNASGVSLLLELARYYQQNPLPYSIAFMAFGAEEVGLLGSRHYVENPYFPLGRIKFLVNVDLVGTGDEGATVVNGAVFEEAFNKLVAINQAQNLLPVIKKRGLAPNSDHYYFTEVGVPSFFIYTLGGIKAYHDIYDRAATLPLTRYEELFKLIRDFIKDISF